VTVYTDASKIAAHLGVTLTADQITQSGVLAQAASDWIDLYLGRSWQAASPVTDELHTPVGDRIYLNKRPVTAVTAVSTRQPIVSADWNLLDTDEYELIDATNGVLLISGWAVNGLAVRASYTHTASTPPSNVALAATLIAASWLGPLMVGLPAGLESVALGQNDINVKFGSTARDVPPEALTLLGARAVVIA
jgi:hypothetical protein